jgi:hypothetical protein
VSVAIDPNSLKLVEVPVSVAGEVSGMVYVKGKSGSKGQGRIIVNFYREDKTLAARTLTESDGYFSYLGLAPGNYIVEIDSAQLQKLQLSSAPAGMPVGIKRTTEGDVVDGLEFLLQPIIVESPENKLQNGEQKK